MVLTLGPLPLGASVSHLENGDADNTCVRGSLGGRETHRSTWRLSGCSATAAGLLPWLRVLPEPVEAGLLGSPGGLGRVWVVECNPSQLLAAVLGQGFRDCPPVATE